MTSGRRLLVAADSLEGGLGAAAAAEAGWFASRGWDVALAGPPAGAGAPAGVAFHPVDMPRTARHPRAMARAAAGLRAVRDAFGPDVTHCHGARTFLAARAGGHRRTAVTVHVGQGRPPSDPRGYGAARAAGRNLLPRLAAAAFSAAPDAGPGWRFLPHASPRLAGLERMAPPDPHATPLFAWIGRLDEQKRPDRFVRAVAAAAVRRPLRAVVLGDGPSRRALEELARRLDAPVTFAGERADVAGVLAEATAVVLLSRYEAVSFAVQEAMWAGRPVVVSPLPGLRWLVGDAGRYAHGTDDAAAALVDLCDPDVAAGAGARAAERVRARLEPGDPWPAVEGVFERLLR